MTDFGPDLLNEVPGLQLMPGERIVARQPDPQGGTVYISNMGGVFSTGGARFLGSYLGLAPEQRQGQREFANITVDNDGYTLWSTRGEQYRFDAAPPPPALPPPVAPPAPNPGDTPARQSARAYLRDFLGRYGLSGLEQWAMDQLTADVPAEQVIVSMRERPEYKARFPGMDLRRQNGLTPVDEATYLEMEGTMRDWFRAVGVPPDAYTSDEYGKIIGGYQNVARATQKIMGEYQRIITQAPEVRDAFREIAGTDRADALLIALATDGPSGGWETRVDKIVLRSEVQGTANRLGVSIDGGTRDRLADLGVDARAAEQGFTDVMQMSSLTQELIGEDDLTQTDTLDAAFNMTGNAGNARRALADRAQARTTLARGGPLTDLSGGVVGLAPQE